MNIHHHIIPALAALVISLPTSGICSHLTDTDADLIAADFTKRTHKKVEEAERDLAMNLDAINNQITENATKLSDMIVRFFNPNEENIHALVKFLQTLYGANEQFQMDIKNPASPTSANKMNELNTNPELIGDDMVAAYYIRSLNRFVRRVFQTPLAGLLDAFTESPYPLPSLRTHAREISSTQYDVHPINDLDTLQSIITAQNHAGRALREYQLLASKKSLLDIQNKRLVALLEEAITLGDLLTETPSASSAAGSSAS